MKILSRPFTQSSPFLQAIKRRALDLSSIQSDLLRMEAGLIGELRLERELADITLPSKKVVLFHYEFENIFGHSHQIDCIVLTQHFILLVEVKNITGTLSFEDRLSQFVRIKANGESEAFSNPLDQVRRHAEHFEFLLPLSVPIICAVVVANSNAILKNVPPDVAVFHVSGFRSYLKKLFYQYDKSVLTNMELDFIGQTLLHKLKRRTFKPLLTANNFRNGVLCLSCDNLTIYKNRYWVCTMCGMKSKNAVRRSLMDYKLFISDTISNEQFRTFTGIESMHAASKILKRLHLPFVGEKRGRKYEIPNKFWEDMKKGHTSND